MTAGRVDPGELNTDVESGYLERIADDVRPLLGPEVELDEIRIVAIDPADADRRTSPVMARLIIDRVRLSFTSELERGLRP